MRAEFPTTFPRDLEVTEVDLDTTDVSVGGERLTEERASALADGVENYRGRPSLTAPGRRSPALNLRISAQTRSKLNAVARSQGRRPSDVVREALADYLAAH